MAPAKSSSAPQAPSPPASDVAPAPARPVSVASPSVERSEPSRNESAYRPLFWSQVLSGFPHSSRGNVLTRDPASSSRLAEVMRGSVFTTHTRLSAYVIPTPLAITHKLQIHLAWIRDDVRVDSLVGIQSMPDVCVRNFSAENSEAAEYPCNFYEAALHPAVMPAPLEGGRPRLVIYYSTALLDEDDSASVDASASLFNVVIRGHVSTSGVRYQPQEV